MMAVEALTREICDSCGVAVRENTAFCYNCGKRLVEPAAEINGDHSAGISDEGKAALDDLAARLKVDENADRIKNATAERKKARVAPRKAAEEIWIADETRSGLMLFVISLVIFLLVMTIVFFTVYWK